uniref:Uncharacterized protein n=1 Tax=Anguilla anguilla TaxID=7936 RepID=A0A0E9WBW1_ANGAN
MKEFRFRVQSAHVFCLL